LDFTSKNDKNKNQAVISWYDIPPGHLHFGHAVKMWQNAPADC